MLTSAAQCAVSYWTATAETGEMDWFGWIASRYGLAELSLEIQTGSAWVMHLESRVCSLGNSVFGGETDRQVRYHVHGSHLVSKACLLMRAMDMVSDLPIRLSPKHTIA
jgi:hypothetical protein